MEPTSTPTPTPTADALDTLLRSPAIAGMVAAAPTLAAAAAAARTERAALVRAAAAAAINAPASGAAVPAAATMMGGAAPILRCPVTLDTPTIDPHYIAADAFKATLSALCSAALPCLMVGAAGTGKTEGARFAAAVNGRPFIKFDSGAVREASDWFGSPTMTDGGRIGWQDSALVSALSTEGCVILLDEVNRAATAALNGLFGILDGMREVRLPQRAEPVTVAANVWIVASANIGASFAGTNALDAAFRSRFLAVPCDYLDNRDEERIIVARTHCRKETARAIVALSAHTREAAWSEAGGTAISTREALAAASLAAALVKAGESEALAFKPLVASQPAESYGGTSPRVSLSTVLARSFPAFA